MQKQEINKIYSNQILIDELSELIEESKKLVFSQTNSSLTMLFWNIGERINKEILRNKRAEYSKQVVSILSLKLTSVYGRNFEEKNLRRMLQFATQFKDKAIVVTLSRQLSWSHFLILIPLKSIEEKMFYADFTIKQALGVRELRKQISLKTFERIKIANIQNTSANPSIQNTFKDPYFLDFLELQNTYLEKDLESAILRELESFILELGKGFTFVERQKRIIIDGDDFYMDLLFYHRNLKRLVVVELKLGKFEAKHKGQMELYLKYLDKYEKNEGEYSPIGLILCAESSREKIELLEMHKDGIMVAEYWTELPSKKQLEQKIHSILIEAKDRIERKKLMK